MCMPGEINTGSGSVRSEYPLGVGQKPANTMKHIDSESKKRYVSEPKPPQANAETDRLMRARVLSVSPAKEKLIHADKRAFSEKFIEIYFEDEEKKSLIKSVKTMNNSEFEFFWKTLTEFLGQQSKGKLIMSPLLSDSGTKGSRMKDRYSIKEKKGNETVLRFISDKERREILKTKGKKFYDKNIVKTKHKGNDIPTEFGSPVYIPSPGKVKSIIYLDDIKLVKEKKTNKEAIIEIIHDNGISSRFVHLGHSLPKGIKENARLELGTIIGYVDARPSLRPDREGRLKVHSNGIHLHFEVTVGKKRKNYDTVTYLRPGKFNFSESNKKQAGSKIHTKEFTAFLYMKKQEKGFFTNQQIALNR